MELITRRSLIGGLAGIIAAPAIVPYSSLMPVRRIPFFLDLAEVVWTASGEVGTSSYVVIYSDKGLIATWHTNPPWVDYR